ncbi:sugar ABC transporter substrate-binding protein [Actinomadura sp. 6N118]|uniref:sugar ABC transporter substrate-binding protein n=1 Tax=Actinomadura sp. 6N118 TaxID=3375151 RepID=UPI0037A31711
MSGPLTDPFFSALKKGAQQAAKDSGVTFQYDGPADTKNLGPDMARLEQAAVAKKPDALVVSSFIPDAQDAGIKQATVAGIPVVFVNAGSAGWKKLAGVTYVGEDATLVGQQAGERMAATGAKTGLCVNHVPGNPTLEARCTGFTQAMEKAGGKVIPLNIPFADATNPTTVTQAITGALRANSSIGGVFTLGSGIAENAVKAVGSLNASGKVTIGTTDLSANVLTAIKNGKLLFSVDQQPYLQGYYSVLIAAQKVRFGLAPVAPVTTAPLFITKDNVDQVMKINSTQGGIRGAS